MLAEATLEVLGSADICDWFAEEGRRAYGRIIPARADGVRNMVIQEPVGPVAGFSPWNFPVTQAVRKIAAALAAGCSIIVKCPEETPGSPIGMLKCFIDAGVPAGVVNLVFGVPAEMSEYLIASPIVRKISFTGSVPVGKHLAALAGQAHETRDHGAWRPLAGAWCSTMPIRRRPPTPSPAFKYRNAGQVCISPTRFFVQEKVYDKFVARFTEYAKDIKLGDGMEKGDHDGPARQSAPLDAMEVDRQRRAEIAAARSRPAARASAIRASSSSRP